MRPRTISIINWGYCLSLEVSYFQAIRTILEYWRRIRQVWSSHGSLVGETNWARFAAEAHQKGTITYLPYPNLSHIRSLTWYCRLRADSFFPESYLDECLVIVRSKAVWWPSREESETRVVPRPCVSQFSFRPGLEIATNTVASATNFFSLATKIVV